MSFSILISDSDLTWSKEIKSYLETKNYNVDIVSSGRDCQLNVYKNNYLAVILDLDIRNHSGLEVLRYLRLNASSVKIILSIRDKKRLEQLGLTKGELRKLGAGDILVKPYTVDTLLESIEGSKQFESWKEVENTEESKEEEEVRAADQEFTKIKIENFSSGNTTIFDHYIRLGEGHYLKILHKGDFFDKARLDKYKNKNGVKDLYFKTKERSGYINFINQVLLNLKDASKLDPDTVIKLTASVAEKYVEEIYTVGLKPQLVEEGFKVCNNINKAVQRQSNLSSLLASYEEISPPAHLFLTAFISTVICQNLEWATQRTIEMIAMGSLLHDIGFLKLPPSIQEQNVEDLTQKEYELYKTHPKLGAEMLQSISGIKEPIIQIVYQHHECVNGEGFPQGLSGNKIYPLAKIVCLANYFANILLREKLTPIKGLKELISDRDRVAQFDADNIRALFKAFSRDKK